MRRTTLLKRLETVYGLMEDLRSAALLEAAARLREADTAIGEQLGRLREARCEGRQALGGGDREGWMVAEQGRQVAARTRSQLEVHRMERAGAVAEARTAYTASRIQSEQMTSVVEGLERAAAVEQERRLQAGSDDRFLSRLHWSRLRDDLAPSLPDPAI